MISYRKLRKRRDRDGVSSIEFALMFPVVLFITFGLLELSRASTIHDTAKTALLAGARRASVAATNADLVKEDIARVFQLMRVSRYDVTVTPEVIDGSAKEVTIQLSIPLVPLNEQFFARVFGERTIVQEVVVVRD